MIKELVKIRFLGMTASLLTRKSKDGSKTKISGAKAVLYALLYLYVIVVFAAFSAMIAYSLGSIFVPLGFDSLYFGLFITAALTLVFIFSIFETKSGLFECRDNELLLSMPIKPRHIVLSRIFTILIYNYLETAIIMLPAIVVYGIFGGSLVGIFGSVIATLMLPLLSTALSSGVGYLVALISKKLRNSSFLTTAVSLVFLAAYFVGYNYLLESVDSLAEMSPEMAMVLAEGLGIFGIVGTVAMLEPLSVAIFAALSLGSAAIAYILISKSYISIVTANRGAKRIAYRAKRLEKRSAFSAMVAKELRAFFSSANYMLNAGLGAVFTVVLGVIALVKKADLAEAVSLLPLLFDGIENINEFISAQVAAALVLVSSMTFISAPAVSLEGKRLWVIKSMPISARCVLFSKAIPHIIVSGVPTVISTILLIIAIEPELAFWPFIILVPILATVFSSLLGIVIGTALPKFDYQSEVQLIKQSLSTMVSMFSMMLVGVGTMALNIWLSLVLSPMWASVILLSLFALLDIALVVLIDKVMTKRYDKFSA